MNLGQLRSSVYLRTAIPLNDGLITPTRVNDSINEAMHAINAAQDWEWLQATETITTVAGTQLYPPAANWMRSLDLRHTDDRTLIWWDPFELRERWALIAGGEPIEWAINVNQILLRPIPDGQYNLVHTYLIEDPDLVSDGDEPLIPTSEQSAITEYASYLVLRSDSENPRAQMAQQAYAAWLASALQKRRRVDRPFRIRVRQGYDL